MRFTVRRKRITIELTDLAHRSDEGFPVFTAINRNNRLFMLGNFLFAFSYGLWVNLRPLHLGDLGASPEQVGSVLSVVAVAGGLLPIPAGLLSDRIGPKRVILGAWVIAALGALIAAVATDWPLAGVGFATFMLVIAANPATVAFVMHNASGPGTSGQSGRVMAVVFASWPAAMIAAPAIGGLVADRYGISASLGLGAAGFCAAAATFSRASDAGRAEATAHGDWRRLVQNRSFIGLAVFFSLALWAMHLGYVLVPTFLQAARGLSLSAIGVLFSLFSVGTLAFNLVVSRQTRPDWNVPLLVGAVGVATLMLWQSDQPWVIGAAFVLMGALSTLWVVAQAAYGQVISAAQRGLALGITETAGYLVIALASWLAGRLFERTPGHELPLVAGLGGLVVVLAIWWGMRGLRRTVAGTIPSVPEPGAHPSSAAL